MFISYLNMYNAYIYDWKLYNQYRFYVMEIFKELKKKLNPILW
jgi:hypothetical protein